ncbi:formate dehydrogenase subunit delta [Methylophaga pinxianii]|uniref:formate dehydrogenase subunit delta n=1 Tax=Methylophaga pinxianii TaxID=2881052 RepID=UPI001CF39BCC|nr:formate dehydrogenase subunit delta [Methylophaga pinxianii]MCB2427266.1 formate dehydrogenase subunit delta [Methylophaga pinxianii]UPH46466.1 formate dehydrogenase subunit delta [Methylophaga pinxianii]
MSEHNNQTATLIKMVNQIAANLSAYAPAEASERIAQHLTRFWTPKMRQDLIAAATTERDISPLARNAINLLQNNQNIQQTA